MERKDTKDNVNVNTTSDTDISIAYQNKDIVSKLFGDQMKGKYRIVVSNAKVRYDFMIRRNITIF